MDEPRLYVGPSLFHSFLNGLGVDDPGIAGPGVDGPGVGMQSGATESLRNSIVYVMCDVIYSACCAVM